LSGKDSQRLPLGNALSGVYVASTTSWLRKWGWGCSANNKSRCALSAGLSFVITMSSGNSVKSAPQQPATKRQEGAAQADSRLVSAISDGSAFQDELYVRYRRPLLQIFLQRRIDRDVAQDLLQRTFLQAIKKIRSDGLEDPGKLGGYLYRTACNLATAYWRGEIARRQDVDSQDLRELRDEALSLEERVDHELLAKCVRTLLRRLPLARDREVLVRFYLQEESKEDVCRALHLSDLQFNQVLWRARQRFGEILRKNGVSRAR
jgi:RNA polymerase sigma-70 factor, ECF subfamily